MALKGFREENKVKWIGTRPGHDGTEVYEYKTVTNGTLVVYTVPAASVFYFCGWTLSAIAGANAGDFAIQVNNSAGAWKLTICQDYLAANSGKSINRSYWPPIELAAAESVRIYSGAALLACRAVVDGWVE